MRFIEKTDSDLQAVVHYFKRSGDRLEFVLFPMIHVGTQEFYDEVSRRLEECDLILAEGIDSRKVTFMSLPYRVAAKSRRLDLLRQDKAMRVSGFKAKIVRADLDRRSFDDRWSQLSLVLRMQFVFIIPVMAFYMFFFVNREKLAEYILRKDTPSEDERRDEDMEDFAQLIGGDRNQVLIHNIKELDQLRKKERLKIGIPYGAKHMSRIAKFLIARLGYRVIKIERLTVFDF